MAIKDFDNWINQSLLRPHYYYEDSNTMSISNLVQYFKEEGTQYNIINIAAALRNYFLERPAIVKEFNSYKIVMYMWYDEQSFSLNISEINFRNSVLLPFGCKLNILKDFSAIIQKLASTFENQILFEELSPLITEDDIDASDCFSQDLYVHYT